MLAQRFVFGLGAVTNLSDGYPWGIWIAIDLIIGTALGCGGFVIAFLVYILNRGAVPSDRPRRPDDQPVRLQRSAASR